MDWKEVVSKYSPYQDMSEEQQTVATDILQNLRAGERITSIIKGMPGSGKTVLCTYLFMRIRQDPQLNHYKAALVIPQESLRATLKKMFGAMQDFKSKDVIGPSDVTKENYDILIVDEGHKLRQRKNIVNYFSHDQNNKKLGLPADGTELDWVLHSCIFPVIIFDPLQVVGPSGIGYALMLKKIGHPYVLYTLASQMRVAGGGYYVHYIRDLLDGNVLERKVFTNYEFAIVDSFQVFDQLYYAKEEEVSLCRMAAGFAWKWISRSDASPYDMEIEGVQKKWNSTTKNWVHSANAVNEVGCIHSLQGYDLNYAFVIIGNEFIYRDGKIRVDKAAYHDKNGKNSATEAELLEYVKNVYYVLLTRGIRGTYLYVSDPELKDYMKSYVECYKK